MRTVLVAACVFTIACIASAQAGEADVVGVEFIRQDDSFRFDVTVRHDDAGWDHYADRWEVVGEDGTVYGVRELAHPHDQEQPFTRSQTGIVIPPGVQRVVVRARDSVHGFGGKEMTVELDAGAGEG